MGRWTHVYMSVQKYQGVSVYVTSEELSVLILNNLLCHILSICAFSECLNHIHVAFTVFSLKFQILFLWNGKAKRLQIQLNLLDPNTVYPNYSVLWSVLSGPVYYPSYFNLKTTRWTELKHPNFSVFQIENLVPKFLFSAQKVIFESECNLAPSWLAQTTLLHLKMVFAHLQWHPINKLG